MIEEYLKDILKNKPKIIIEDNLTLNTGVKPYVNIENYEKFLKDNYIFKFESEKIKLYELDI